MPPTRVPHSFELLPPRSAAVAAALPDTLRRLAATGPEFFSVTYGASGSSREGSFDLVQQIAERPGVDVMAHLTCVGTTHAETAAVVRRFLDAGVLQFLAIRGDPVAGAPQGDIRSAAELVQLVHHVQAERVPWVSRPVGGSRARVLERERPRPRVAVAAFVNGHPGSRGRAGHLDALLAKQVAGAELAITQLFFHAADYTAFVARARAHGITIPIVPGVMPVTSRARLQRMLQLSGEDEPSDLAIALEVEPTEQGQREAGIAHAVGLVRDLVDAGAPALHLYTFNRADAAVEVLDRAALLPDRTGPLPDRTGPLPDRTVSLHDRTVPLPERTGPLHDRATSLHDRTTPLHDRKRATT